jgi:hypothetical protein
MLYEYVIIIYLKVGSYWESRKIKSRLAKDKGLAELEEDPREQQEGSLHN